MTLLFLSEKLVCNAQLVNAHGMRLLTGPQAKAEFDSGDLACLHGVSAVDTQDTIMRSAARLQNKPGEAA